ncbi:hypothetical protein NWF32_12675 [Pseudomonas qingdaonensis]|nr:hypothetical protein [Pseudomonas qingdaonensis]
MPRWYATSRQSGLRRHGGTGDCIAIAPATSARDCPVLGLITVSGCAP